MFEKQVKRKKNTPRVKPIRSSPSSWSRLEPTVQPAPSYPQVVSISIGVCIYIRALSFSTSSFPVTAPISWRCQTPPFYLLLHLSTDSILSSSLNDVVISLPPHSLSLHSNQGFLQAISLAHLSLSPLSLVFSHSHLSLYIYVYLTLSQ